MNHPKSRIRAVCYSALLSALVLIASYVIRIPVPPYGVFHFGDIALVVVALVFGKKHGAVAGAVGMGLFDLLSGYMVWTPFTVVIRALMGFLVGQISALKEGKSIWINLLAVLAGGLILIAGYFAAEGILYGNWITPITSVPANALQVMASVLGVPLAMILCQHKKFLKIE